MTEVDKESDRVLDFLVILLTNFRSRKPQSILEREFGGTMDSFKKLEELKPNELRMEDPDTTLNALYISRGLCPLSYNRSSQK